MCSCLGGKINLTRIGATATQGPPNNTSNGSMRASLAIDGAIVTNSNTSEFNLWQCAASTSSTSVNAWLRIDLQDVYLISKVVVTFHGTAGKNAVIRVGSSTSNDGNDNLLCGTVGNYSRIVRIPALRIVECKERLWGRYVNIQRQTPGNLDICEVEIYNGLYIMVLIYH